MNQNKQNKKGSRGALKSTKILGKSKKEDRQQAAIIALAKLMVGKVVTKARPRGFATASANNNSIDKFPRGNATRGFAASTRKSIHVSESEYIGEVTVAAQPAFNIAFNLPINPGQASTFPWLSTIAKQYEKYVFRSLKFVFKPEVTQFSANTNTGKIIMSADYDSSDPIPTSKVNMENTLPHTDGMPYETLSLVLDPKELHLNSIAKYVRPGPLPGFSDIKSYDAANIFVATQGQTANSIVGELHVVYTVELSIPVLEANVVAPTNNSIFNVQDNSSLITSSSKQCLFNVPSSVNTPNVNGIGVVNTSGSLMFPVGNYYWTVTTAFGFSSGGGLCYNQFFKNAIQQNTPGAESLSSGIMLFASPSISGYFTSNGTDVITVTNTAFFPTGTCTAATVISVLAI